MSKRIINSVCGARASVAMLCAPYYKNLYNMAQSTPMLLTACETLPALQTEGIASIPLDHCILNAADVATTCH